MSTDSYLIIILVRIISLVTFFIIVFKQNTHYFNLLTITFLYRIYFKKLYKYYLLRHQSWTNRHTLQFLNKEFTRIWQSDF
jgi:hypothetical protein